MILRPISFLNISLLGALIATVPVAGADRWTGFRGDGTSRLTLAGPPTASSAARVAWKVALTGKGQSSPVVWDDALFVIAVDGPEKSQLVVQKLKLDDGRPVWTRTRASSRRLADTDTTVKAAGTPVVDEHRLYAAFESGDVVAYRHDGTLAWTRSLMDDYGEIKGGHQWGSSLVIVDGALVINVAHQGPSYLIALDPRSGKTRWKIDRPTGGTWMTPTTVRVGKRTLLIVTSKGRVDAHVPETGALAWSSEALAPGLIPSPTVHGDLLVVASSDKGRGGALSAADGALKWTSAEATNDFSSPAVVGGVAMFINKVGVVYGVDLATGRDLWTARLPGPCWATTLVTPEFAWFFTTAGHSVIARPTAKGLDIVASNELAVTGRVYGVAAARGALFLRTDTELIRLIA
jgi:outer membrane protein assembly factor BamB